MATSGWSRRSINEGIHDCGDRRLQRLSPADGGGAAAEDAARGRPSHDHRVAGDELARGRQRVGERGARGAQIESPRAVRADLMLDQARRARKHHVGRHGADHDQIDVVDCEARVRNRAQRRLLAEIRGGHARLDDVALADACALQNPFVRGLDELLQIRVGQELRRHVGRERRNRRRTAAGARCAALRRRGRVGHHNRESLRCSAGATRPK